MKKAPLLIDNRDGNTLARNLADALQNLSSSELCIATAFFSPAGFKHIADHLSGIPNVRLLLGADPSGLPMPDRKRLDETLGNREDRRIRTAWKNHVKTLTHERDQLPFNQTSRTALEALITVLRRGNMQVRRYTSSFLHAKAYIQSSSEEGGVIAGSSNLTHAGLTQNLELNLGCFDPAIVDEARKWFDDLWEEAEPYDLAEIYEVIFQPQSPWSIFLRVLWQLYGDEVKEDVQDEENLSLPLTEFQKHGVARAIRLIRQRGGVIVADEVGLGKTFIAGEVLQIYNSRRQRGLLICPASLRDSTWKQFLTNYKFSRAIECLSFEELARDEQLRDPADQTNTYHNHLQRSLDEYQLVIIDEAHNYRNPNTPKRAAVLRRLLFGKEKKRDLLLLTATPVNNSLWDLYHLIRFFVRQDAFMADRGVLSIYDRFSDAMQVDPANLSPDVLYPIIDATTVKRTRQFVKKHYANDVIIGGDGMRRRIEFPEPHAITIRYALEKQLPGFFDELENCLNSSGYHPVKFARYMPDVYRNEPIHSKEDAHLRAMMGILRSGLLKRFESSSFAFGKTVRKMVKEHEEFLERLDQGGVITTAFLREVSTDDEDFFKELSDPSSAKVVDSGEFKVEELRRDVTTDCILLKSLADAAESITKEQDGKLMALSAVLRDIVKQAEKEASDNKDEAQRRKVMIFSTYADTVSWIQEFLRHEVGKRPELECYKNRLVAVSGSQRFGGISKEQAVLGFAPVSMQAPTSHGMDRYDIMISTDVLAEGVNLQQCRHIINYDVPWNPMRLVQRHGRIDRINSPHNRVFLRTLFPSDRLDDLLNLEERIRGKIAMAAASVGVISPLEDGADGDQVFTETRQEIEKILKEDPSLFERGVTVATAQTGEEYRQILRKVVEEKRVRKIANLPWKAGSGMQKGKERGLFFCAVVGQGTMHERTYLRFVRATEEWAPGEESGSVVHELGTCLRMIECEENTPIRHPEKFHERVYDFWGIAQSHVYKSWQHETDPKNLQPKISGMNRKVSQFIQNHPPRDMNLEKLDRAIDILDAPWPKRESTLLREWFNEAETSGQVHTLVENVLGTGFEPSNIPHPLPSIKEEDVKLLCWIAIEPERKDGETQDALAMGVVTS